MRYTIAGMRKKKIKRRGDRYFQKKFQRVLYYGKKDFAYYRRTACEMLNNAARYWTYEKRPLTVKDYEKREFYYSFTELAVTIYKRVKEGLRFRERYKFRDCKYKKYTDRVNKRLIFDLQYYRKTTKDKFHKCFILYYNKSPLIINKAELSDALPSFNSLPFTEFGKFRHILTDFEVFNEHFYPNGGSKYGFTFTRKSWDLYKVKSIKI